MSEEKELCDKCGVNPANEMHECPYGAEINDDYEECNCCDDCMSECSDAI